MARLMRYMFNMNGRKLFSTVHIKLGKPLVYDLVPPVIEIVPYDTEPWHCGLNVINKSGYAEGTVFYYTTDGSEPTKRSLLLTADTEIDRNCTVRIIAVNEGSKTTHISATFGELIVDSLRNGIPIFWIKPLLNPLPKPSLIVEQGSISSECIIDVSNKDAYNGAKFYYTIDGNEPDSTCSELPAMIDHNCTVKVKAITESNISFTAEIVIDYLKNELPQIEVIEI